MQVLSEKERGTEVAGQVRGTAPHGLGAEESSADAAGSGPTSTSTWDEVGDTRRLRWRRCVGLRPEGARVEAGRPRRTSLALHILQAGHRGSWPWVWASYSRSSTLVHYLLTSDEVPATQDKGDLNHSKAIHRRSTTQSPCVPSIGPQVGFPSQCSESRWRR